MDNLNQELLRANTLMQMFEDLDNKSSDFKEGYHLGAERVSQYGKMLLELYGEYVNNHQKRND